MGCIDKIIYDFKNEEIGKRLEKARKNAIKNFSEEFVVKKTIQIYNSFNLDKNRSYLLNKDLKGKNNWLP